MKYFYTDPLEAAFMAKHFGMRFVEDFECSDEYCASNHCYYAAKGVAPDRICIHPHSLHLLEPQVGDVAKFAMGYYGELIEISGDWLVCLASRNHINTFKGIMGRNGIAFMWPEAEE